MKLMEPEIALSLKNILLAVDFSAASETAVRYARAIARQCLSDVHTVHVNGPDCYHLLPPEAFRVAVRDRAAASNDMLPLIESLLEGLPNEVPLRHDGIWGVLADVVSRNQIDLLILGTHGRTGLSKFIRGSVAEQIFRNVSCPVLTVGPEALCFRKELAFNDILLASNLDPHSAAPMYASWLCNEFQGTLTALHVADESNMENSSDNQKANQVEATLALDQRAGRPRIVIEHGEPGAVILEVASSLHPDVVVLGARHAGQSGITGHIPWSTASRVIAGARCPVLTVRELM